MRALNHTVLMVALVFLSGCTKMLPGETGISVTTENPEDQVIISERSGEVIFEIHSPGGIGGTVIEFQENQIPDLVIIHLYLKGLEELQFNYGNTHITASVSSQDSSLIQQTEGKEGALASEIQSITPDSPYWLDIVIISETPPGENDIPIQDGYFQVKAPQDFLDGNYPVIELLWIGFFR
jgi:hypothetical protein